METKTERIVRLAREIDAAKAKLLQLGASLLEEYAASDKMWMADPDLDDMARGALIDAGVCPECLEGATLIVEHACGLNLEITKN